MGGGIYSGGMQLPVSAADAINNWQGEAKIAGSTSHSAEPAKAMDGALEDGPEEQAAVTRGKEGQGLFQPIKGKDLKDRKVPAQATCHSEWHMTVTLLCASISLSEKWATGHSGDQSRRGTVGFQYPQSALALGQSEHLARDTHSCHTSVHACSQGARMQGQHPPIYMPHC